MNYSHLTQQAISFIENHLLDNLHALPKAVGYSKYHLLRVFKKETGLTIGEYVRLRRLAKAAILLIQTNEPILEIAISLHFQSQEAFSRAFKEVYAIPPGQYRKMMRAIQMKKEEKQMVTNEDIKGWTLTGSNPENYEMHVDYEIFHTGSKSGVLYSVKKVNEQQFATMMQGFQAKQYCGKRLKLSCFLKTDEAAKAGAWMRIDSPSGDTLAFDNMHNRSISGTTDWNHYTIVLDVPEEAASIHFGVLLIGKGKVWADNFLFTVVDEKTPTTNNIDQELLPEEPINLSFE